MRVCLQKMMESSYRLGIAVAFETYFLYLYKKVYGHVTIAVIATT